MKMTMKRCPKCNAQFDETYSFCGKCGTKLETIPTIPDQTVCKACGAALKPGDMFCGKCGANIGDSGRASRKSGNPSRSATGNDNSANALLESAQVSYRNGQYSDCVRYLEKAIAAGSAEARRLHGRFLDESAAYREAYERNYYAGKKVESFTSSIQTAQMPETSAEDDSEDIFQSGLAAYNMGRYRSAFSQFQKAADQGHVLAQFNLAELYRCGKGVPASMTMAVKYYTLAANHGDMDAQKALWEMGVSYY